MPETRPRSLRELSRVIFARWPMVMFIVIALTGGTLLACLRAEKSYRSSVTFLAREPRPQNPTAQEVSTVRSLEVFIKTQYELVTSQTVLARTLVLLNDPRGPLAEEWQNARQVIGRLDRPGSLADAKAASAALSSAPAEADRDAAFGTFRRSLAALDNRADQLIKDRGRGEDFREQMRRFAKRVKVEVPGGEAMTLSEIFTVTVTMPGPPEKAQATVDLLARCYIDRYREVQADSGGKSAEFMRDRLDQYRRSRLAGAEASMRDFVEKQLQSPSDVGILEQLTKSGTEAGRQIVVRKFQEELITLDAELAEGIQLKKQLLEQLPPALWGNKPRKTANGDMTVPDVENVTEARLPETDPALTDTVTIIPETTLKNNVVVSQLKAKEVALLIELNRLQVEYNAEYRSVRDKRAEIARTRRQILRELIGEAAARDIAASIVQARQNEIRTQLATETQRLDKITRQLVRYQELQNEVAMARDEYRKLTTELASADQFRSQEADAITINIVDPAQLPDVERPAFPNTPLFTILAAAVGVLLSTAYAFTADHFDHTLRSIVEAERYLGVPVVGSIGRHRRGLLR